MRPYEKIETVFARDINGSKLLMEGVWRNSTIEFLKDLEYEWTEKIDGTNVRVYWDGHTVAFGGRTDKAQFPAELMNRLNELFGGETNAQMFEQTFGEHEVILYGEGFGRKIQNGGSYIPDGVDFILFDLMVGGNYQPRESVERCAKTFGVRCVPIVGRGTLEEAVAYIKTNPKSTIGTCDMEGVVCRPLYELQDRCGNRIIVKIKWNDFKQLVENKNG